MARPPGSPTLPDGTLTGRAAADGIECSRSRRAAKRDSSWTVARLRATYGEGDVSAQL